MSFCCTWRILVLFKLLVLCSSFFGIHLDFLGYCIKMLFSITKCLVPLSLHPRPVPWLEPRGSGVTQLEASVPAGRLGSQNKPRKTFRGS